jgi:hypothetical protein
MYRNVYPGHIRHHNRPSSGIWYLREGAPRNGIIGTVSYQLSLPSRSWTKDPIFKTGESIIILDTESRLAETYHSVGWIVRALDSQLKEFEFFWSDEISWRSVWQR